MNALEIVRSFDASSLPDLDIVTLAALERFASTELPGLDTERFNSPIVLGSGNALTAGRVLFGHTNASFADESSYTRVLERGSHDGAFILSASGGKHARTFAEVLQGKEIPTVLLTNNEAAPAAEMAMETVVFPKNREPYTYNTSTYMSMFLAAYREDPSEIAAHIDEHVQPAIDESLGDYGAYYFIIPEQFSEMRMMFTTKFDELFGPNVLGRVFTYEQSKHAKTVVASEHELFISLGVTNDTFGSPDRRLHVPLPKEAGPSALMACAYFVIGNIQKQKQPYFKESIESYTKKASRLFGEAIPVIVE